MSIMQNLEGTTSSVFSIGVGSNKVDIRDNAGVIEARNYAGDWFAIGGGGGIDSMITKTADYIIITGDADKLIVLTSATAANRTFTLPSVGVNEDGMIVHCSNMSGYSLTITPSDTDKIWISGAGYGIINTDGNGFISLYYNHATTTWYPINSGNRWALEGLGIYLRLNQLTVVYASSPVVPWAMVHDDARYHDLITTNINACYMSVDADWAKFGSSVIYFDGASGYLTANNDDGTVWQIFNSQATVQTISCWVYPRNAASAGEPICGHANDPDDYWSLYRNTSEELALKYRLGAATYIDISGGVFDSDVWHHVVLVKNLEETGLYLNGTQVAYDATFTAGAMSGQFYIAWDGGITNFLKARMQDMVIMQQNYFNAAPNVGLSDTITVPTRPLSPILNV